jgi:hypothetical protein
MMRSTASAFPRYTLVIFVRRASISSSMASREVRGPPFGAEIDADPAARPTVYDAAGARPVSAISRGAACKNTTLRVLSRAHDR